MTTKTMTDDDKIALAKEMFAAWEQMDWARVVDLFAEDGVLHSVMQEPVVGREALTERMAVLGSRCERLELRVRALGVIDGRVFAERVDDFDFGGHHGEVPVVGVLAMEDGRVAQWLEYYDRPTLLAGMGMAADFAH